MRQQRITDEIETALNVCERELIEPAATLYGIQKVYGDEVRQRSKLAFGRLVDAHLLLAGVIGAALLRVNGKVTPATDASEERNALFASYIIGMETCESAIEEGRYLQACVLLRQEMETLAQLKAVKAGKRNEKGPPNVRTLAESIRRLYDDLSAAAHVSKHHMVRTSTECSVDDANLPGPTSGTRYFPAFVEELARRCFATHLILTLGLIEEMSTDWAEQHEDDSFNQREVEAVNLALKLMHAEGMVEIDT